MLILSRKLGESVVIGDQIVIRIVELRRSRVRIGIEAPLDVRVRREEHQARDTSTGWDIQVGQLDELTFDEELLLAAVQDD